ncbi:MAG TPA: AtpZ/AtpI family protein [Desulfomonilia bacterium]|jgi:F0F1-type ATP synthase assembly protein I|nr:AtpZ/AtpI family protein [Desulfomonilia bacterium]
MKKDETRHNRIENLNELVMLSAWGAILVVASFLFLFVGIWVDAALDTGPFFMLGLLILAVFLVMGRLYMQFRKTNDRMGNIRRRHA